MLIGNPMAGPGAKEQEQDEEKSLVHVFFLNVRAKASDRQPTAKAFEGS